MVTRRYLYSGDIAAGSAEGFLVTSDRHRSLSYRPALDGLRGIAVAAVVVFHVWPDALPGGWLGVDVFFVLSGFLITSLLVAEWNSWGTISLLGFWAARARRLLPALVAMLLAVSVASYFWTIPSRRLPVSLDVMSALFYVANWRMLFSDEQYFADTVGLPSPVLHTWSLAIEEQYYLLFPLLLLLLLALTRGLSPHRRRNVLGAALLVLAALSAWRMGALYVPGSDPNRIYYGTDTRIFELFIGAAAGVWVGTREFRGERRVLFDRLMGWLTWPALALLLFAFAVLRFDSAILFPGGLVLVCVVAAVPVCGGAAQIPSRASQLLAFEPLRRLGLISYSLYLWHWPVVVFLGPSRLPLRSAILSPLQVVVSLVLAVGSYWFIERPVRAGGLRALLPVAPSFGRLVGIAAVPALVVASVLVAQTANAVGPSFAAGADTPVAPLTYLPAGYTPLAAVHKVSLIGNSIPASVDSAFRPSRYPDIDLRPDASFGCDTFAGSIVVDGKREDPLANCSAFRRSWTTKLQTDKPDLAAFFIPQTMVLDHEADGRTVTFGTPAYSAFIRSALDEAKRGAASAGVARFAVVTLACHNQPFANTSPKVALVNDIKRVERTNRDVRAWARERGVAVIDQFGFLCTGGYHPTINGTPLYPDGLHFSAASGAVFWTWFAPQLQQILRKK